MSYKQEVIETMCQRRSGQSQGDLNPGSVRKPGSAEKKPCQSRKSNVGQTGHCSPERSHHQTKGRNVKDIFYNRETNARCYCIDYSIHGFVKVSRTEH